MSSAEQALGEFGVTLQMNELTSHCSFGFSISLEKREIIVLL